MSQGLERGLPLAHPNLTPTECRQGGGDSEHLGRPAGQLSLVNLSPECWSFDIENDSEEEQSDDSDLQQRALDEDIDWVNLKETA